MTHTGDGCMSRGITERKIYVTRTRRAHRAFNEANFFFSLLFTWCLRTNLIASFHCFFFFLFSVFVAT